MTESEKFPARQETPGDQHRYLGIGVKRADQAIAARKAEMLREVDLTVSQCVVLGQLMNNASKSCTQLARESLVTSQTMTGIVSKLETKGLVERRVSPDHGRVVLVSLTPSGRERADRAQAISSSVERGLSASLSPVESEALAGLLQRLTDAASTAGGSPA